MDIGKHCFLKECNQEDFLPFQCKFCKEYFCLEHRQPDNHFCQHETQNTRAKEKIQIPKFPCIVCKKNTNTKTPCNICNKNVCLTHRFSDTHPCKTIPKKNSTKSKRWWSFS